MADTNLIKKEDLIKAREVDFVGTFGANTKTLLKVLGVTRTIAKQAGTLLRAYTATGVLLDGVVAEGETIPLSKYEVEEVTIGEIVLHKYRKATSAEAIISAGYDKAVDATTDRMLKDVQGAVRADLFNFLATGTGVAQGKNFQGVLANAWGQLQTKFEDDDVQAVYFVNPLDVADYLATANITTQTAFGMTYVEDFLGLGTVVMSARVPKGKVYATAKDNIVCYYIPVNGGDLAGAFAFTADETGLIGIHEEADYTNMTASDTVVNGMVLFAERLDGVIVGTINA